MVKLLIKEIAEKQGLQQNELATRSKLTPQLINRYWHNHTLRVELDALGKIAGALGVDVKDLIESSKGE